MHVPHRRLLASAIGALVTAAVAGCGVHLASSHPASMATGQASPDAASTSSVSATYSSVPDAIATTVRNFANLTLSYNSQTDSPTAFLNATAPITTTDEQQQLARSGRAHLNWPALQARGESTSIEVTGLSMTSADPPTVVAEIERTTTTSFGSVNDFVQLNIGVQSVAGNWLVASASGGGL